MGPGVHKILSVPSKSLFPQSCLSSGGSMVVNCNLLQEGFCHTQVCSTQSPCPCSRPLLTHTSKGDTQTLKGRSGSGSVESPGVHKVLSEPSKNLWPVWGLILNAILPLLPSCCGFSFAPEHGISPQSSSRGQAASTPEPPFEGGPHYLHCLHHSLA